MSHNDTVPTDRSVNCTCCGNLADERDCLRGESGETYSDRHQAAVAYFQSKAEPKVKDAVWTRPDIFKVGMFSDGTSRNGYAESVCMMLDDFGFKGQKVWVQVIDFGKLLQTGKWEKMGEAHCR